MIPALLEVAMRHAMEGRVVFPCAKKKPLVPGGFKNASLHPEDLSRWWAKWPNAQVGLPTGAVNHLFVLDVDGAQADAYVEKMRLPDTFTVETSPGHRQLWFHQPAGVTTKCTAGVLAPELDTRGDGGYTIALGSIHHETGQPYRALNDLPWVEMPPQLLQAVNGNGAANIPADAIPQGRRHQTLLSMAGALRARGLAPASVLAALVAVNEQRCVPPLPMSELQKLATYVGTKRPGFRGQTMETTAVVSLPQEPIAFPQSALTGSIGELARVLAEGTEVPEEFYYAAAITLVGTLAAGKLAVRVAVDCEPRLFTVLLGQSADVKKSSALRRAIKVFLPLLREVIEVLSS